MLTKIKEVRPISRRAEITLLIGTLDRKESGYYQNEHGTQFKVEKDDENYRVYLIGDSRKILAFESIGGKTVVVHSISAAVAYYSSATSDPYSFWDKNEPNIDTDLDLELDFNMGGLELCS